MPGEERGSQRIRGTTSSIGESARLHRRNMTPAEDLLWKALRGRRLRGLRFRRQHPLGPFIVDFCCPERRLIVEVDGDVHDDQFEYNAARTEHLTTYGYHVIRFRNETVLNDLNAVLKRIAVAAEALEDR